MNRGCYPNFRYCTYLCLYSIIMPKIKKVGTPGSYNINLVIKKQQWKLKLKAKKKEEEKEGNKTVFGRPAINRRTPRKGVKSPCSTQDMDRVVNMVEKQGIPIAKAARIARVPRITLHDRLKGLHKSGGAGRPLELTRDEEDSLVETFVLMEKFNFPLTRRHLQDMVKEYLDRKDKLTRFPKNRPGPKWARNFVNCHSDKSVIRCANNIRRSYAAVSPAQIREYFANLHVELEGFPSTHIFNCDETNLADNPTAEKCIFAKGIKYPEQGGGLYRTWYLHFFILKHF